MLIGKEEIASGGAAFDAEGAVPESGTIQRNLGRAEGVRVCRRKKKVAASKKGLPPAPHLLGLSNIPEEGDGA
jgi:hypothetical protein